MSISAVNCTPIKPQVSFGKKQQTELVVAQKAQVDKYAGKDVRALNSVNNNVDIIEPQDYKHGNFTDVDFIDVDFYEVEDVKEKTFDEKLEKALQVADDVETRLVVGNDIKNPATIVASLGVFAAKTFAVGAGLALIASKLSAGGIDKSVVNSVHKLAEKVPGAVDRIATTNTGKLATARNFVSKGLSKATGAIATAYNKTIASGDVSKEFTKLVGTATAAIGLAQIGKVDNNKDGVADIVQKSQSVYNDINAKSDKIKDGISFVAEVVQALS